MVENSDIEEEIRSSSILVVDDADFSRELVKEMLKSAGFNNIDFAYDGNEAIKRIEKLSPDLIILDLMMPNMDGFTFCNELRKNRKFARTPVIVQSAMDSHSNIARAFKIGATDYTSKPINHDELIARVKLHLENVFLIRDVLKYKERVEEELRVARRAQRSMMPSENEIREIGFQYKMDIANYFETSSELGGDFWGVKGASHKELVVYNVDFSGHGINAAVNTFRLHALLEEESSLLQPEVFMFKINNKLHDLLDLGQFATMFYAVINVEDNSLAYSCAAVPNPITITSGQINIIDGSGIPLGVKKNTEYEKKRIEFNPGDSLLMYSDALIETFQKDNKPLSEDDLLKVMKKNRNSDARTKLNSILAKFSEVSHGILSDDLTVNIFQRRKD